MFEAMWCLSAGTGRLTFTRWVQKRTHELWVLFELQKSHSNYFSNFSILPRWCIPFAFVYIVITSKRKKKKKKNSSCNIRYSLLWISSEIQMIEKGVCTFSLLRGGCPRPRLVNKNFNVHIGFSTSHYFYNPHIKQYWCIKCLPFADCVSLYRQDIPEDLHHVQRPQPSWQDDLVINEQKTVLTITRREKTDQNNQQFSGLWLRVSIPSVTFISGRLDDRGRDIGWIRSLFFHFWKSPAFWVESDKKTNWIFFCCCCWTECVIKNTSGE